MKKQKEKKKKYKSPHLEEVIAQTIKGARATCGNYCGYSGGNGCSSCGGDSGNQECGGG